VVKVPTDHGATDAKPDAEFSGGRGSLEEERPSDPLRGIG
jgi:hypothetical protein